MNFWEKITGSDMENKRKPSIPIIARKLKKLQIRKSKEEQSNV